MREREVNRRLREGHLFDDPAILRRTLVSLGMTTRNPDASDYCRREHSPPSEARALISLLEARRRDQSRTQKPAPPA